MPRYMIERTFAEGLHIPINQSGIEACTNVNATNATLGVSWVHSYVSEDKAKTFCIYDAPDPEAVRKAADRNGLPVDRITRVTTLDPYFYS